MRRKTDRVRRNEKIGKKQRQGRGKRGKGGERAGDEGAGSESNT